MKARTMSKKMPFLGQKSEERHMNILQWNAGGLSSPKMTEIKKTVNEENIEVLITNEANFTKENIQFCNMNSYTIYALHKSRQIVSGMLAAVKTTLTSKFHITMEINWGGGCVGMALSSCNLGFLQTCLFLITNRNTIYLLQLPWDAHNCQCFRL
jgi:hypothetical protein